MKIYKEKEQAEQDKIQNENFEGKGNTRKWNRAKFWVQRNKWIKEWDKGSGDLRTRSHPDKFPSCGKKLKKNLEPGMVGHTFNPSAGKVEVSRYLCLRPAWST